MKMLSNKRKRAEFIENKRLAELQQRVLADLRQRAAGLEARIDHDDDDLDPKIDLGSYWLCDAVSRRVIWPTGLPPWIAWSVSTSSTPKPTSSKRGPISGIG